MAPQRNSAAGGWQSSRKAWCPVSPSATSPISAAATEAEREGRRDATTPSPSPPLSRVGQEETPEKHSARQHSVTTGGSEGKVSRKATSVSPGLVPELPCQKERLVSSGRTLRRHNATAGLEDSTINGQMTEAKKHAGLESVGGEVQAEACGSDLEEHRRHQRRGNGRQLHYWEDDQEQSHQTARSERLLKALRDALSAKDVFDAADYDGFIPITKLFKLRPDVQSASYGSCKMVAQAIEAQEVHADVSTLCPVRIDKAKRRVRLWSAEEVIRAEAERVVDDASPRGVPIGRLVALRSLRAVLSTTSDPAGMVRKALSHEDSQAMVRDSRVVRRPRGTLLRKVAEELLSEGHLAQDSRLRSKVAECGGLYAAGSSGGVPITWLCSRYAVHLGLQTSAGSHGARSVEASAAELCEALVSSQVLLVDTRRLTVTRRRSAAEPANASFVYVGARRGVSTSNAAVAQGHPAGQGNGGISSGRAATQLRQLLDYYFEPFTLQHNRYLLDLLTRRVGPPTEPGPWVTEESMSFSCAVEELAGLGRVAAALAKLGENGSGVRELGELKHLRCRSDGRLQLTAALEVRCLVAASDAPPGLANAAVRYLSAAREQRGQAPAGHVSVLSYAVGALLVDDDGEGLGSQRRSKLKRQLLVHHTDIVCLQGCDVDSVHGAGVAATLSEEGYAFACARVQAGHAVKANTIFWDRSRWEKVSQQEHGEALSVLLRPFEELGSSEKAAKESGESKIRVACFRPEAPLYLPMARSGNATHGNLKSLFGMGTSPNLPQHRGDPPLIVCADLTALGGAEGASVVEELSGLSSVALEVLGEEIAAPMAAPANPKEHAAPPVPLRSAANGMNRLRSPDAVLYGGALAPVCSLSGHTEGYLATMSAEDVLSQFPAFRMPLVAAFDWRHTSKYQSASAHSASAGAGSSRGWRARI